MKMVRMTLKEESKRFKDSRRERISLTRRECSWVIISIRLRLKSRTPSNSSDRWEREIQRRISKTWMRTRLWRSLSSKVSSRRTRKRSDSNLYMLELTVSKLFSFSPWTVASEKHATSHTSTLFGRQLSCFSSFWVRSSWQQTHGQMPGKMMSLSFLSWTKFLTQPSLCCSSWKWLSKSLPLDSLWMMDLTWEITGTD